MSGSYTNTDGRSDSFNTGSAHDTGLYDPNRHDNQIVAVFESRTQAEAARDALLNAGIPASAVEVLDRTSGDAAPGATRVEDRNQDEGFWGAIKSLFAPDEDYNAYHHALGRGHAMVMVIPTGGMDRHRIIEVLEAAGPLDFDAKLEEWRQSGYDYSGAARATDRGRAEPTASSGGAGTGYKSAADTAAATAATPMTPTGGQRMTETVTMPQSGGTKPATSSSVQQQLPRTGAAQQPMSGNQQDTVKVVEERLRVGKREVAQGAVKVRSYVERPVEEQVRLHEERVQVERRPVDRPVTDADAGLFQERTIEARATSEEAVVQKEARVVEEIGIRKEAQDRTETVRDTVRETKVEVDDKTAARAGNTGAGNTGAGKTGTGMGTRGTTTNATPGTTPGGTNPPRK